MNRELLFLIQTAKHNILAENVHSPNKKDYVRTGYLVAQVTDKLRSQIRKNMPLIHTSLMPVRFLIGLKLHVK